MSSQWRDSGFYANAERIGAFLLANLITACLLLTVIGAPLGLLGLFALMNAWVAGREPEFFRVYVGSIRSHWRAALGLGGLNLAGGGLVAINLTLFPHMAARDFMSILSLVFSLSFAVVMLMANLYAWTIISRLGMPLRQSVKLSLLLALSHPLRSMLIAGAALVPILTGLVLPIAFLLFLSLGASAYIAARGSWWVLRLHFSREELASLLAHNEI